MAYAGSTQISASKSQVIQSSAVALSGDFDAIVTDPPYYDAIPYSDLMDFFYVWLRRSMHGLSSEIDASFSEPLGPKWNHETADGELIDDASRFAGDKALSSKITRTACRGLFTLATRR